MAESNHLTQSKDDITAHMNSQIILKFGYSMRNRTYGGVELNQGVKVNQMVVAPLLFGRRSLLRRALLRRCTVVDGDGELRMTPRSKENA
jgi:hypothetical protein